MTTTTEDFERYAQFLVNRSGFPINNDTYEKMWEQAAQVHSQGYKMTKDIRTSENLQTVAMPQPPTKIPNTISMEKRIHLIQHYINALQYNHTGLQMFEIKKKRPINGLMEVAKEMIKESLPIKCLEAVILALYLTSNLDGLARFPISFKTVTGKQCHRHVILGLYYNGSFGSLGLSRREDLMFKPLNYNKLSDLIKEFITKYSNYLHKVKRLKIGFPVPHVPHNAEYIEWKGLVLNVDTMRTNEMASSTDTYSRIIKACARDSRTVSSKWFNDPDMVRTSTNLAKTTLANTVSKTRSKSSSPTRQAKPHRSYQIRV